MRQPGIEPGVPRSKSKRATTGLTILYVRKCHFSYYKTIVNRILKFELFSNVSIKPFLSILMTKVDFYKEKAIPKTFFEGRPLVITPL